MQLVFDFSQWLISPRQGVVGRQYDNLSHSLVVEGELPSGNTGNALETKSILSPYQTFYVWERIA